jgi:uncharacterized membrane protein
MADRERGTGGEGLANFLGLFSLGLGLAEFAMPGVVSRIAGLEGDGLDRKMMRAMGLREIAHGVSVLSSPQPKAQMWGRVAGDALDLALLGKALTNRDNARGRTLFATGAVLGVTALDVLCARQLSLQPPLAASDAAEKGLMRAKASITIQRSIVDVYAFWRDFENLPRFMHHLESVTVSGPTRSHWKATTIGGKTVEWDAEIIQDRANELIAWRSLPGSQVYNEGTVRFTRAPGDRGTEVRVEINYDQPLGRFGAEIAKLFRDEPAQQAHDDLRRFKQVMETGSVTLSDATKQPGMHPGQPNTQPIEL